MWLGQIQVEKNKKQAKLSPITWTWSDGSEWQPSLYLFSSQKLHLNRDKTMPPTPQQTHQDPFALACGLVFFVCQTCTHPLVESQAKNDSFDQPLFSLHFAVNPCLCSLCRCNHKHVTHGKIIGLFIAKWPQYLSLQMSWLFLMKNAFTPSTDICNSNCKCNTFACSCTGLFFCWGGAACTKHWLTYKGLSKPFLVNPSTTSAFSIIELTSMFLHKWQDDKILTPPRQNDYSLLLSQYWQTAKNSCNLHLNIIMLVFRRYWKKEKSHKSAHNIGPLSKVHSPRSQLIMSGLL